jgi:MerR family transcriptional regulator, light-induced transcriptional regulator
VTSALSDPVDVAGRFDHALACGDEDAAVRLLDGLLEGGADLVSVLVDLIASAQRGVGRRWQQGAWSVAQEHVATAVATAATAAVARYARRVPVSEGRIVLACAEREWHVLPLMIVGYAIRASGWDVTLLGASTSPLRLSQNLHDLGPDATLVSCSVLGALPTTRRFVEASTAMGIPVVVGGAAFGRDDMRALAIGATAWADGPRQCLVTLRGLPAVVPAAPRLPLPQAAEQSALELAHLRLAGEIREQWSPTSRRTATDPSTAAVDAVAHDVVHQALHAVSGALLTGDPRLLPETAVWIAEVLAARGADPRWVAELGRLLATTLRRFPLACDLVERHWASG